MARWSISGQPSPDPDRQERFLLFETALALAKELGIANEPIPLDDVFKMQKRIHAVVAFSLPNHRRVRLSLNSARENPDDVEPRQLYVTLLDLGDYRVACAATLDFERLNPIDEPQTWSSVAHAPVALALIDRTPAAFKQFVEDAKTQVDIEDSLIDELPPEFMAEALGDCTPF